MMAGASWQEGLLRVSPQPGWGCFLSRPSNPRVLSLSPYSQLRHCASSSFTEIAATTIVTAVSSSNDQLSAQLTESTPLPSPAALSSGLGASQNGGPLLQPISVSVPYGNRHITIETGLIGRQASGAVTVTDGDTIIYATACAAEEEVEPSDFTPLSVHYQERFSAAGRTSGGFFKREGRAKDHEILICRLIDRPLRPMIAKGFNHETQILSWVFSYDAIHPPEPLAIVAASAALALSDIPVVKTVGAVRVGMVDGEFIVNPTVQEMELSQLDMIVAGSGSSIIMIEGCCKFVTEEKMLQAISLGQEAVVKVCEAIEGLVKKAGKAKRLDTIHLPSPSIYKCIEDLVADELTQALQIASKSARKRAIAVVESKVMNALAQRKNHPVQSTLKEENEELEYHDEVGLEDGEVDEGDLHVKPVPLERLNNSFDPLDVKVAFKQINSKLMRSLIIKNKKRSDGRGPEDIRPIQCSCSLLPRAHGSALFTRGETQALAVTTLGGDDMGQRLDNLTETDTKRFYFQYTFPPSSVGETGRVGAPSRREIGHGMLAEKALEYALPPEDVFPYTIRLESTITESNGSSSMASVCGGCLAMLDAGIPLKESIAGVAMGLILNPSEIGGSNDPVILSDIIGAEDALGDMDFKIAGSADGVTAFQMDIKVDGVELEVLEKALLQARDGRRHILGEMSKCNPAPSRKLSKYAPLIDLFKVEPEKINSVIGSGGKTVRSIIDKSGVESIDLEDDGSVRIVSKSLNALESAKSKILGLTMDPVVGSVYRDCPVVSIVSFGCFLEIAPGREGLCHISELSTKRIEKVEDILKVGDRVDVKLIEMNSKGQMRLSRRALLLEDGATETQEASATSNTDKKSEKKAVSKSGKSSDSSKDGETRRSQKTSTTTKNDTTEGRKYRTDRLVISSKKGESVIKHKQVDVSEGEDILSISSDDEAEDPSEEMPLVSADA
ncbi:hypothetical protein KP509_07G039700 [Ceratopteris richardii]|uniref:polyribonucleotide nucleotidyltransferase n=2 Tax=Ceratopteris richardii TaxID=49495 RepID=A0A8T2UE41_CERRI|nr:hypothetical protein KP509_07G039700 [Ceratopteris richardii]